MNLARRSSVGVLHDMVSYMISRESPFAGLHYILQCDVAEHAVRALLYTATDCAIRRFASSGESSGPEPIHSFLIDWFQRTIGRVLAFRHNQPYRFDCLYNTACGVS